VTILVATFFYYMNSSKSILFLAIALFSLVKLNAQENGKIEITRDKDNPEFDLDLLPASFHQGRREALKTMLPDSTIAVFFASPIRNRSNDVDYEYHQDPDFYYLTGLREPDAMLILSKNDIRINGEVSNEFLFIREKNQHDLTWNGWMYGVDGAKKILKIKSVMDGAKFADIKLPFEKINHVLIKPDKNDARDNDDNPGDIASLRNHLYEMVQKVGKKQLKEDYLVFRMAELREIKLPEEIDLMRKAIQITCKGLNESMRWTKPNIKEYEAEAVIEYYFKKHGSEYPGYPSICGGGENATILHYNTNRRIVKDGELLLLDVGAEYHGYTADVTRTFPVNGKFTEAQKIIYNIVLEAQNAGIAQAKPGNKFWAPHNAAFAVVQKRLLELGIIKKAGDAKQYFMHGTSHYLGLDVHDAGTFNFLKPNSVITVEPGIYIPEGSDCDSKWWNIGIRIEDDILITPSGNENLSISSPRSIEEIEKLMTEKSIFEEIE